VKVFWNTLILRECFPGFDFSKSLSGRIWTFALGNQKRRNDRQAYCMSLWNLISFNSSRLVSKFVQCIFELMCIFEEIKDWFWCNVLGHHQETIGSCLESRSLRSLAWKKSESIATQLKLFENWNLFYSFLILRYNFE
jgi:hypothetical protein